MTTLDYLSAIIAVNMEHSNRSSKAVLMSITTSLPFYQT